MTLSSGFCKHSVLCLFSAVLNCSLVVHQSIKKSINNKFADGAIVRHSSDESEAPEMAGDEVMLQIERLLVGYSRFYQQR